MDFRTISLLLLLWSPAIGSQLVCNPLGSPQVLHNSVCSGQQGRSNSCRVELYVPSSWSVSCPIVFFLHGSGGTIGGFRTRSGVHDVGVIGVYPQGEENAWNTDPKPTNQCEWSDFDCIEDPDEGAFMAAIISELRSLGAMGNVYVIGTSNGGALANRLAVNAGPELPIAGFVSFVTQLLQAPPRSGPGSLNYNTPSSGNPKVSVLNIMGTADPLIPYNGGSSAVFGGDNAFSLYSALDSMQVWAAHNGCSTTPIITSVCTDTMAGGDGTGLYYQYTCPDDEHLVEHYAIAGGNHGSGGSSINGVPASFDLALDFILRCETGTGPTTITGQPIASPSPERKQCSTSRQKGCRESRYRKTGQLPHSSSFICHASVGGRRGYSHDSGTAGPRRCKNDDDLHSRQHRRSHGSPQPAGSNVIPCRRI